MVTVPLIIMVFVAYLLGSVPSSVWIGRLFYGVDVREKGSGNAGATNTIRVLGWKAGLSVLVLDMLKGWLAVSMIQWVPLSWYDPSYLDYSKITLAMSAVLGHIFPVFAGFRGGKGVATLLGVGIGLYGQVVLFPVGIFLLILVLTGYVSLASVLAGITFPLDVYLFCEYSIPLLVLAILVALFVPLTHLKNITRLIRGQESKFVFRKKK